MHREFNATLSKYKEYFTVLVNTAVSKNYILENNTKYWISSIFWEFLKNRLYMHRVHKI
jgi:hypothetical protein